MNSSSSWRYELPFTCMFKFFHAIFWTNFTGCVIVSVRDGFIKQLGGYLIFSLLTLEIYEKREGALR